jgi:hypothetical protein
VLLGGQIQRRIGGVQVGVGAGTVGQALHAHVAEHSRQRAGPSRLDGVAGDLVSAEDPGQPRLPLRAQVQVVLKELAEHLPAGDLEVVFQLRMGQSCRLGAAQPCQDRLEAFP